MSTMASPIVFTSYEQVLTRYFPKRAASLTNDEVGEGLFESTLAYDVIDHLKKELNSLSSQRKAAKPEKAKKAAKR